MNFRKTNNILGWLIFGIATFVYFLTVEKTGSFWDSGEFISSGYKLQVPHPPGAPFYLLVARVFTLLSFGEIDNVAYWINMVSVVSSGFTILFLFWSIVMISRKLLNIRINKITQGKTIMLLGAGAVGALSFAFSDSFWFSATEAEVYAMSSFFTAFVVWAMLKWDLVESESKANRWLVLIAFMMGLSIGVHLLNLVAIPALGLIYYFKKYNPSWRGVVAALTISGAILILINNFIIPGLPGFAGKLEVLFVNSLGLPFGTGALFFLILLISGITFGIYYSQKYAKQHLNTALLSLTFLLIGYSSYAIILIRSNHNPPIDQNDAEDVMSFVKYLNREQYGSWPLLYGPYFNAKPIGTDEGDTIYVKGENKYVESGKKLKYRYDKAEMTLLPRIYSNKHEDVYRQILNLRPTEDPTFADNIAFFFKHQLGTMYLRYFNWNFIGRQSDIKGAGVLMPWDALKDVPAQIAQNKGRNNFFGIPLILGLAGLFYHYRKNSKGFAFVGTLFFLSGIALVLYLNSPPVEPRERDYIYVGSFFAFAIWIGIAVIAVTGFMKRFIKHETFAGIAAIAIGLAAPAIMVQQGWDDHDRSGRYFSEDGARNYLASCAPNAILFTGGDNDTYPLWYVQEVEGYRTDVRVVVLGYLNADWYIDQMKKKVNKSEPFPFTLEYEQYRNGGPNGYLPYQDLGVKAMDVEQFIDLIAKDDKRLRLYPQANVLPSKNFVLRVDKAKISNSDFFPDNLKEKVVDKMQFSLKPGRNSIYTNDLMILDLLASNNWERPIYLNNSSMSQLNIDLSKYIIQEGMTYRIVPVENPNPNEVLVNTEVMYENLTGKFKYRNLDDPGVFYNEDYRGYVQNHRSAFNTLAAAFIREGNIKKAKDTIDFSLRKMPDKAIPYDITTTSTVSLLYFVGEDGQATKIATTLGDRAIELADYYIENDLRVGLELEKMVVTLGNLQRTLYQYNKVDKAKKYEEAYQRYVRFLKV